ncbi:macrolide transporter ATP-binding /permease protein [Clostridium saccharobutylicum]|uniref:ABC transporter permease n=1 Tax=Clostridium saccharobutylicum TaxID=169679 RepID=UPI000983D3CD|nr:ABC transporter permease [Clostridium saccharobutylicum]AQS08524.1 macrolide transporter ATP-binding /permease protein [Clostridium saccharobutylicum]MBC2436002.1 FtsX-like permease family protein [Clostridium saccharobutylicum]NSB87770.1 ABC-type antimicrobial peptide transport system permease subunit [Clostridium saccharobutylicum]NYC29136.1 ABC-type antimicrobial peptide transport system permease subunit [Clostridium saccharobutylicum]OOM13229.1 macrolide transporter ATP-binding /permeas
MKSYLSLIPISAKVHRRQNRMTLLCIIFAVFLVTAVFSMADMGVRMEATRLMNKHVSQSLQELSKSSMAQSLYPIAAVLFVLILIAGVLMISSSINSNVVQRTKFFGMMRCIGMSRQQIIRFVKLEALNWCKTAVPIGIILGIAVTWGLCAGLRFLVSVEFSDMPLFGVSPVGIVSGIIVGVVTVLIAARSPAKRAAKVSPIAAVSGNLENTKNATHALNTRFSKIETALGIHHAVSAKKNLILMTSSFALSIILFLSFSVLIEFIGYIMPQSSNTPDINIDSNNSSNSINSILLDKISGMSGVKHVFGRRNYLDIPAEVNSQTNTIDMISYDDYDLECLTKDNMIRKGSDISKVYGDSNYALTIWDKNRPLKIGDKIQVGNRKVEIAGLLKCNPFSDNGSPDGKITIITSGKTFTRLTGITDYSLISIQTTKDATDRNVEAIHNLVGEKYKFTDQRDQRTMQSSTYIAFEFFVYGFLAIITLVTVLNIMNSISMSVSAKIKQYGAMRAVGMDEHQITKMIAAEAFTYSISGCIVGVVVGLFINKLLYDTLITAHFNYATWSLPIMPIIIVLLVVTLTSIAAIYSPSKRIRNMAVTDTINEL